MKRISDFFQPTHKKSRGPSEREDEEIPSTGPSEEKSDGNETEQRKNVNISEKRQFLTKWLSDDRFKGWLKYMPDSGMKCEVCMKTSKTNPFTNGCTNYRTSTLLRHQSSQDHLNALSDFNEQSNFRRKVQSAFDKKEKAVVSAMRCAYWLGKEKLATLKFSSLIDLMKLQGCEDIESLYSGDNATYQSERSAEDFQDAISTVIENELKTKLRNCNTVSLMCDESDDVAIKKKLVCYVRFIPNESFEPETHFLTNTEIDKGDAETVYNALKSAAQSMDIDMKKVMFFGSDGASVMTGPKSGVSARLKNDQPYCINIHCMAHKLALCTSQAADSVPYLKKYREILTNIFYFFKHSSLRTSNLRKIEEILEDKQMKIKEIHSVRWFAFYSALEAIFHTWSSLVTYFEQEKQAEKGGAAKGIHTQLTQFEFIGVTYLLMDIIPILTKLSLSFQKENIDIAIVQPIINSTISQLEHLLQSDGLYMQELQSAKGDNSLELRGHHISVTKNKTTHLQNIRKDFIHGVIEQIKRRFPVDGTSVVSALAILGLRGISFVNKTKLTDYGSSEMSLLCDTYSPDPPTDSAYIDSCQAKQEWDLLKHLVLQQMYPTDNIFTLWKILYKFHQDQFVNLLKLAELALIAPLQTADCERGFSAQNDIKTADRNRMSPQRLNTLMRIATYKSSVSEFNFNEAVKVWRSSKNRRAFTSCSLK